MTSKSPIRDYSRLLGVDRTVKKQENIYKLRTFDTSDRIADELRSKLDLSLKHNSKLLDENSDLSELVSKLRNQAKELNQQLALVSVNQTGNIAKVQAQRAALMDQLDIKQMNHEAEIRRLLEQVARLHNEKNDLEIVKAKEFQIFKEQHEKNMNGCIQSIRSSHENAKDLYETQIRKLKQVIENRQRQVQSLKAQHKLQNGRLQQNINNLQAEMNHLKKLNTLQLQEIKNIFGMQLHKQRRTLARQMDIQVSNHQLSMKKLKNQVYEKTQQINSISKKMANNQNMHSLELQSLKRQKQLLLSEIATAEVTYANLMTKQKSKLKQINQQEVKNILQLNQTHINQLRGQINHIKNLLDCKSTQIKKLLQQNGNMKNSMQAQIDLQQKTNQQLRNRMKTLERDNLQQIQAFKIKIAKLVDIDIKSLISYYQNQLSLLQTTINDLQNINKLNKQKLYKALQDNDQLRKNFQIQISKQKARVQDLKIKLASLSLQHKQQVTSLATKMELTSQTLVREADQKNKSQAFFDQEKKKFHSLTNAKDKQITDLLDTMHQMKKLHQGQIAALRKQKSDLREQIDINQQRLNEIKKSFEQQMKKREQKYKNESKPQDEKQKQLIKQLYDKNEQIQNENIKLQKQVQHLIRENRTIAGELGMKKGFIQTLHLQSSAAIQDEKTKLRALMGNSQLSLKQYFQDKLNSKDKDIQHLQKVVAGKQQDIRDLIVKYNGLQKRMEALLASQEKLRDLEEKIKNLGMDNNLVKNMAELFNRPQGRVNQ